jgi:hypothetical protein|uniref:Uncharacterized protein n=1 Tax=Mus musculus TaxID=10090 RepID=Q8CBT8_MOUSE|nr:unnamed protein product [Mus musculus]
MPSTERKTEALSHSEAIENEQDLYKVNVIKSSKSRLRPSGVLHSKHLPVGRGSGWSGMGGEQMAWGARVIFLVIPEAQEMSFPQSLGLAFHSISSCFIRRNKGPAMSEIPDQ